MKKKGFTLIELLAVIVVLAIIALIAVPTILGIIEKSRKGALMSSANGLVDAGILYHAEYQNENTIRFDIKNNEIDSKEENKIKYKGNIKEGTVLVNNSGEVVVCVNDGKYAAYKNFNDNKVTLVEEKTCNIPENSSVVYLDSKATDVEEKKESFGYHFGELLVEYTRVTANFDYIAEQNCYVQVYLNGINKKSSLVLVDDVVVGTAYSDSTFVQTMVLVPLEKGQKLTIQPMEGGTNGYAIFAAK